MKKYLLSIGALATVAAPTIAVISCGSESSSEKKEITIENVAKITSDSFANLNTTSFDETAFKQISLDNARDFWTLLGISNQDKEGVEKSAMEYFGLTEEQIIEKYSDIPEASNPGFSQVYYATKEAGSNDVTFTVKLAIFDDTFTNIIQELYSVDSKATFSNFGAQSN